jgi:tetratricopeptide (TPR) repeat protein
MQTAPRSPARLSLLLSAGLLLLVALACLFLYAPALDDSLMIDDRANLSGLSQVHDLESGLRFISAGRAGPLGRPLSLASFTLHAEDWPESAGTIKYTNVLIHLFNGLLLYLLLYRIGRYPHLRLSNPEWFALSVATLWLLHPLLASTSLMIIQRMTSLMGTFVLGGLLLYVSGRRQIPARPKLGYGLMTAGLILGTLLGTLCKENGALFPLFVLIIEFTLLRPPGESQNSKSMRRWLALFTVLPLAALLAYFLLQWDNLMAGYAVRPFTLGERLLTENLVLLDYLRHIFLPGVLELGPFHDDFPVAEGLLNPASALAALIAVLLAAFAAWGLRKRFPIFSFAVFWFLAGHSLESSFIALELYFEHRNYLPIIGPLFAICYWAWTSRSRIRPVLVGAITAYGLFLGFLLWQTTLIWSQPSVAAEIWAREHPGSTRAIQYYAIQLIAQKDYSGAKGVIEQGYNNNPADTGLALQVLQLNCAFNTLEKGTLEKVLPGLRNGRLNLGATDTLRKLFDHYSANQCGGLSYSDFHQIADALLENPRFQAAQVPFQDLLIFKAHLYLLEQQYDKSVQQLKQAFELLPNIDIAGRVVTILSDTGHHDQALEYLNTIKLRAPSNPAQNQYWQNRSEELNEYLLQQKKNHPDETQRNNPG